MESALPEKRCVEDGKASQQQEELSTPMEENPRGETERPGGPGKENGTEGEREKEGADQEEEEDGEEDGEPCANSTTHSETNTGQMNGDAGTPASDTSPKTPSKSPSTNRTGRRNQEMKDRSSFICPLCDKNCQTQHHLTMHIRQHNTEIGGNDHSCSICGKALSSASSLDRHMLVHSGERPYKCSVCGQTFTTNGNMHRHMKIHDKGPNGVPASRPISPTKRRKAPKRNLSTEDDGEKTSESPNKKVFVVEESGEQNSAKREEDLLHCPICFKTFICKYGLESHMETHPDTALRCNLCCITFRTHRGLLRHNSVIHKQLPTDPSGRPFIQNNPSIPLGFSDLSFIDFSCSKFPQIAQVWCETNLRRCSSKFHRFICEVCNKGFPLQVSLDLHMISHEDNDAEPQKQENDTILDTAKDSGDSKESAPQEARVSLNGKKGFMECLGLQHSSLAKAEKPEEEKQQEILDSIRFIRVEPSATNLPQENNSSLGLCLLDPISLQGLNKGNGLSVLSLQPLQGGLIVRPISQAGVELADIQQILKMTGAMPSQMTLPLLSKGPESPEPKQVIPLKPKPLVAPRSSMGASTPPPVMNAQQASSGCISPSLPPPAAQLLTSKQSSNTPSSSASSSPTNWENTHLVGDGLGPTIMASGDIKQEEVQGKEKDLRTSGGKKIPKTEYPCRFCTQVFSFPGGLQTHMRAHHYGASPYKCTICTYTAPDNATLMRHLRTHSGERPYVCRLCHYPFTVKANCERHLRKKHMKNTRKEIEKNIEYVTSSSNASSLGGGTTQDLVDSATIANTSCRYCGEDLKTYRALQIHLRTLNGCQRKPFECRQCGAAFLAKRNCIHHLLKQHSEVQEREIEDHINTLVPVTSPSSVQTNSPVQSQSGKQTLVAFSEAAVQDQPLDFSSKTLKCKTDVHSDVQLDTSSPSLSNDCSMEPIDLSIRKGPEVKKIKTEQVDTPSFVRQEVKKELPSPSTAKLLGKASGVHAALPASMSSLAANLTSDTTKPLMRLKPLLPKPVASSNSSEMPPLASIAQIISSVSAAPVLLKTGINSEKTDGVMSGETLSDKKCSNGTANPGSSFNCPSLDTSKRRGKKRAFKDEICDSSHAPLGGFDLESSGELPSVEKMLATTDANKFSSYLQLRQMEPEKEKQSASEEEKEGKEDKERIRPRSKGKKNAYSNSVQKMKCPYCPRVFPWTSSLQRHMLTHTGQKPFPCPQCDAFFSTKSNCERHLLRKHGISNRNALQNTGSRPKTKGDDGSQGSTEGGSDAESTVLMDAVNPIKEDTTTTNDMDLIEQDKDRATGSPELMKDLDTLQPVEDGHMDIDSNENDEDSQSNKSLDMNDASKPLDVPLSETDQEQPKAAEPAVEPEVPPSEEFPHTCNTCKKTFRHAATLSRHQKIHSQDNQNEEGGRKGKNQPAVSSQPLDTGASPIKEGEQETCLVEKEENSSIAESGAEEEEKEGSKDEKNEEEEGCSSELESAGGRPDKRKKICNVCSKRFWSLQDLTRHMRSHTGERPYQCQTCDRTFTLKHSLVRHQRIHQKTPDDQGADEADGASAVDGEDLRCSSGSDSETTPAESQTSKTDDPGVKEDEETSTAEASKELQTKEMDEMDTESPEPKDEADPSLKDKQDAADKPVV